MEDQNIKKLALIISANCCRASTLEQCHQNGQISHEQEDAIHQELTDRIYTFLTYLLQKPASEYSVMMEAMAEHYPEDWRQPELSALIAAQASAAAPNQPTQH